MKQQPGACSRVPPIPLASAADRGFGASASWHARMRREAPRCSIPLGSPLHLSAENLSRRRNVFARKRKLWCALMSSCDVRWFVDSLRRPKQSLDPGLSAKRFALGSSAFAGQGAILEYELTLTGLQPVYETAAGGIAFKLPFCTIRVSGRRSKSLMALWGRRHNMLETTNNCASRAPMKDRHVWWCIRSRDRETRLKNSSRASPFGSAVAAKGASMRRVGPYSRTSRYPRSS